MIIKKPTPRNVKNKTGTQAGDGGGLALGGGWYLLRFDFDFGIVPRRYLRRPDSATGTVLWMTR